MNYNEDMIQKLNETNMFQQEILNPFLNKSKKEYPNSIVETDSNMINITLFKKFPKIEYNFKYEEAIRTIGKFLKKILPNYGLTEMEFHENSNFGFNPSFIIKVPTTISSKELVQFSEDIFKKIGEFADLKNIGFILDDLSIILSR